MTVRFPIEPLEAVALAQMECRGFAKVGDGLGRDRTLAAVTDVAAMAGTSERQWRRWRAYGVPLWHADRLAVALGRHPGELWPEYWEAA